jgi:hypothetical protein
VIFVQIHLHYPTVWTIWLHQPSSSVHHCIFSAGPVWLQAPLYSSLCIEFSVAGPRPTWHFNSKLRFTSEGSCLPKTNHKMLYCLLQRAAGTQLVLTSKQTISLSINSDPSGSLRMQHQNVSCTSQELPSQPQSRNLRMKLFAL